MKKTIIIIVILLVVVLGIYYMTSNNNSNTTPAYNSQTYTPPAPSVPSTPATPPVSNPTTAAPSSASVEIKNFSFNPSALNIKAGTKVTWTNNDSTSHTITADSGNLFDSGPISPGQSFSFTFTNSGSINYHCNIHPTMQGVVVVKN